MGSGIGLALEYVEMHGGEINLESEAGKGSVFVISLPEGNADLLAGEANDQDSYPMFQVTSTNPKANETVNSGLDKPLLLQ